MVRTNIKRKIARTLLLLFGVVSGVACSSTQHLSASSYFPSQTSDSVIVGQLRDYGIHFSSDNSLALLMSGQQKFDDMFHAIRQARHSIHLEYFNFRNDSIASLLFDILREKRREGVIVRALFDAFGNASNNQPLRKHHLQSLRADSIEIYEYDPLRFPWVNRIWPRDHRKIVVIDGSVAYTGGMNVADYYINGTEQVGAWRDMHCRIEGTEVNTLQHIFVAVWKKTTGQDLSADSTLFRGSLPHHISSLFPDADRSAGRKTVGIVNREPGTKRNADGSLRGRNDAIRKLYVTAIDAAQDSIRIINPYFTLTPSVTKALKRAIDRGVKVELMISTKSDIPLTPDCAFYQMHRMMKRGAHVWFYEGGFHHTKIMTVDGRLCTVGSANLNSRSLRYDYEENAVIADPYTTHHLDSLFIADKQQSFLLTPQTWDQFRTPWQKLRGWLAHLLVPFL